MAKEQVDFTNDFEEYIRQGEPDKKEKGKNWKSEIETQSAKITQNEVSKSKNCTFNCTLEEHFVLEFLKDNPRATQKEIAAHIRKSERTVKTMTSNMQNKNLLERVNGKRNGFWKILIMEEEL